MTEPLILRTTDPDQISNKAVDNNNDVPQDKFSHASIIDEGIGNGGHIDNSDQVVNDDADNDDEVLIMNFDDEWGEDVVLPMPINSSIKQEPHEEEIPDANASKRRPSLYFPIGTDSEAEQSSSEQNSQGSQNENLTQIPQTAIDNLHTTQDLDETLCNVKLECLSQSESQTLRACTTDDTELLENGTTVVLVRSDSTDAMSENALTTSAKDAVVEESSNNAVKEHVPFEEPKTEPLENTVITSEEEVLPTHFLLETDHNGNGNEETMPVLLPETTGSSDLPYSVSLQTLFTCNECGYQTSKGNDLKQHLSESHMDIVPDVSTLLSVDRPMEMSSSSEMDSGSTAENIDCSTPPPLSANSKKIPKLLLKSTLSPRTSRPNWSLQEVSDGEDEMCLKTRNIKRQKSILRCFQCSYTAKGNYDLKMHKTFVHSTGMANVKCLKCPYADTRFAVWKHMVDYHGEKSERGKNQKIWVPAKNTRRKRRPAKLRCQYCSFVSKYIHSYRVHLVKHENSHERVYQCPVCPAKYFKRQLKQHIMKCHPPQVKENYENGHYQCPKCSFLTRNLKQFEDHLMSNKGLDVCDPNNKTFHPAISDINDLVPHIGSVESPPTIMKSPKGAGFQCTECPFHTMHIGVLRKHVKHHETGVKMDKCSFCDFIGSQRSMIIHVRKHSSTRSESNQSMAIKMKGKKSATFLCHKCDFTTIHMNILQKHIEANKNLTKCIHVKKRGRKPVYQKTAAKIQYKEIVSKDVEGKEIVTIDLDDIDDLELTDANNIKLAVNAIRGNGELTVTPVIEPVSTRSPRSISNNVTSITPINQGTDTPNANISTRSPRSSSRLSMFPSSSNVTSITPINQGTDTPHANISTRSPRSSSRLSMLPSSSNVTSFTPINQGTDTPHANIPEITTMPSPMPTFAATGPLTYKCKMCVFITNYEQSIKDHINHHLLKRHHSKENDVIFQCQKCNFKTRVDSDFADHIAASKDKPNCVETVRRSSVIVAQRNSTENIRGFLVGDIIELDDSDDEDKGNTDPTPLRSKTCANATAANVPPRSGEKYNKKCEFCDFLSSSNGGLIVHMRFIHKQEYAERNKKTKNDESTPKPMLPPLIPLKSKARSKAGSSNTDTASESDRESPRVLSDGNESQELRSTKDDRERQLQMNDPPPTLAEILKKRCYLCSFSTTSVKELRIHEASHNFKCDECNFETPSRLILQGHLAVHQTRTRTPPHLPQVFQPEISSLRPSSIPTQTPPITVDQETSYPCLECDYVTKSAVNYKAHRELHIRAMEGVKMRQLVSYNIQPAAGQNVSIEVFQCSECTYETNNNSELQIHQQVHQPPIVASGIPETPTSHYQRSDNHDSTRNKSKNCDTKKDRYYTQEKGVTSRISSASHKENKDKSNVDVQRKSKKKSSASESDDFEPSKISVNTKKRKWQEKTPISRKRKRDEISAEESSSTKNDLSDLEDLLDERELMSKEIKKEVMEKDYDLEDLLDYVDISSNTFEDNMIKKEMTDQVPKKIKYHTSKVVHIPDSGLESHQPKGDKIQKKVSSNFNCPHCKQFTTNFKKSLRSHIKNVHKKSSFICQCGYATSGTSNWKNHECNLKIKLTAIGQIETPKSETISKMSAAQSKRFSCSKCDFKTHFKDVYLNHIQEDCVASSSSKKHVSSSQSTITCQCGFIAFKTSSWKNHQCKEKRKLTATSQNKTTKPETVTKLSSTKSNKRCSKCDFTTRFKDVFLKHIEEDCSVASSRPSKPVTGSPKYKSKQLKPNLTSENVASTQSKVFRCRNCDFKTRFKEKYLLHKNEGCDNEETLVNDGSKFEQPGNGSLESTRTSSSKTLVKMFKCPLCFYKNEYKHNVEKHFSSCHVEDPE